ncbi:uncharacterized protein C2orf42 homolog isoform X1 [Parasteatoda tepidariorum]|uniref:uncharacterized protein C2orf42 homolog isoform X1 n=1 Tax=Parasteatoda tepidariorum TaxID=114398 RepID=UPI001C7232A0|nr:uncharacterized protein C2orf42 homolog isoform X1 [Parasteatoda tepidariorum]
MTEKKPKSLFENLGKPTLRGVRKCPKCGTYNGTRGLACKNKDCSMKFKVLKTKHSDAAEAVKINSCNIFGLQIFSVKIQEAEDDSRCFIRLPLIEGMETLQDEQEVSIITRSAAVCFAANCRKPTEDTNTITLNMNPCNHTLPVVNCTVEAKPLILKEAILNVLPISDAMKQEICSLITKPEEETHLVQRINKHTMVVKCVPDESHPLGFLHFFLYEPVKNARKYKILCECKAGVTKPFVPREKQLCVHYYMCVCAFASDEKLSDEFKNLFNMVFNLKTPSDVTVEEVLKCSLSEEFSELKDFFVDEIAPPSKKKKQLTLNSDIYLLQENGTEKEQKRVYVSTKNILNSIEDKPVLSFDSWLNSVVERINQTMHYQFNGQPEPLVFQVPQSFFNIIQQRLSEGSKKKRLPNSVVGYNRKDALPIGIFSKYIWKITNIIQLKRVFYTPDVTLEVQRSFTEVRDGVFVPLQEDKLDPEAAYLRKLLESKPKHINPVELKTFLKVGHTALSQTEPTPFTIEWIPDILPVSKVGEMKLIFEYGHQRNGIVEHRFPTTSESSSK